VTQQTMVYFLWRLMWNVETISFSHLDCWEWGATSTFNTQWLCRTDWIKCSFVARHYLPPLTQICTLKMLPNLIKLAYKKLEADLEVHQTTA